MRRACMHVWICDACGCPKTSEGEVRCWECGTGEMRFLRLEEGVVVAWDERRGRKFEVTR